jgi:hypothetical protein
MLGWSLALAEHMIFMNDWESKLALRSVKKHKGTQRPNCPNGTIRLSGILYIDGDNWTVWIDDVPYSSIGQKDDFSIDEVTEDCVLLTMSDGSTISISVNHNDSY